jgi:hypothetical protein
MNQTLKRILIGLILVLMVLFAGSYISFRIVTSPKRLKNAFQKFSSQALGLDVKINDAKLKFGRLLLKNISVDFSKESELRERYEKLIKCKEIECGFKILPLLGGKIVFKEIYIKEPLIFLSGQSDIDLRNIIQIGTTRLLIAKGLKFNIKRFKILDGSLNFIVSERTKIETRNLDLNIRRISDNILKLKLNSDFVDPGMDEVVLGALVDISKNYADISSFKLKGYEGVLDLKGNVKNLFNAPQLNLKYEVSSFPIGILPKNVELIGDPSFKGTIEGRQNKIYLNWNIDFFPCDINYKKIYYKSAGENMRFQGGIIQHALAFDINWYVIEMFDTAISGTGTIENFDDMEINVIFEAVDLKRMSKVTKVFDKYIDGGTIDFRGKLKKAEAVTSLRGKVSTNDLKIKNIKDLTKLYKLVAGSKKEVFNFRKTEMDIFMDSKILNIDNLKSRGGDIAGRGRGYYRWNKEINFDVYPKIYGKEIGLKIYGTPEKVKISLK